MNSVVMRVILHRWFGGFPLLVLIALVYVVNVGHRELQRLQAIDLTSLTKNDPYNLLHHMIINCLLILQELLWLAYSALCPNIFLIQRNSIFR